LYVYYFVAKKPAPLSVLEKHDKAKESFSLLTSTSVGGIITGAKGMHVKR